MENLTVYVPTKFTCDDDTEDDENIQDNLNDDSESINIEFESEVAELINQNAPNTRTFLENYNETSLLIDDGDGIPDPAEDEQNPDQLPSSLYTSHAQTPTRETRFASCFRCSKSELITSGHFIEPGMHLKFGKYFPIRVVGTLISKAFDRFGLKHRHLYYHHAIVLEVHVTSDNYARCTLMELTKNELKEFEVIKKDRVIDLTKKKTFHVKYNKKKWTPEQIVKRANKFIAIKGYNAFDFNCEHIAVECVAGESESFMSADVTDYLARNKLSWVVTLLGKLIQVAGKVAGTTVVKFCRFVLSSVLLSSIVFFVEFVFACLRLKKLREQMKSGLICKKCYDEQKVVLFAQIFFAVGALVALLIIPHTSTVLFSLVGIVAGGIVLLAVPPLIGFLHTKVRSFVNPLYRVPTSVIKYYQDVHKGDMLIIPNDHSVIVKDIRFIPRASPCHNLHVDIVHFRQRGLFSRRYVTREKFTINLKETYCQVLNFPVDCVLEDQEVVTNAINKIGEDGHNPFSNRSSHMSRKCKIKPDLLDNAGDPSLEDAKTANDVKEGDLVKFRFKYLPHQGIVVEKHQPADIVEITYYHVIGGEVKKGVRRFDLDGETIWIYDTTGLAIKAPNEILDQANSILGEKVHCYKPYKSSRFAKDCVFKDNK